MTFEIYIFPWWIKLMGILPSVEKVSIPSLSPCPYCQLPAAAAAAVAVEKT